MSLVLAGSASESGRFSGVHDHKKTSELTTVLLIVLLVSGVAFAAIAVLAHWLVGWLYPALYTPYATLVVVLFFGMLLEPLSVNLTSALWRAERPDLNVAGKVVAAAVAIAWAYADIAAFGFYGAGGEASERVRRMGAASRLLSVVIQLGAVQFRAPREFRGGIDHGADAVTLLVIQQAHSA